MSVCVLCGMLRVSDFVKGMQCNICTFAYGQCVCVHVCVHVCVRIVELNDTCCHCSGTYDTHISSKVMLIFYVWVKEHLVKNRPISIPLGSVIPIIFRLCL